MLTQNISTAALVFVTITASRAFSAVAIFAPSPQGPLVQGTPVTMNITLQAQQLPYFDSADIVILSDVPFSFQYSSDFITSSTGALLNPPFDPGLGLKPFELYMSGNTPVSGGYGSSIVLGTIVLDTGSRPAGVYEVLISSAADMGISSIGHFGNIEQVEGSGHFAIIRPECVGATGDCLAPHPSPGCYDAACCDCVCQSFGELGSYCCEVEWDGTCVQLTTVSPCDGSGSGPCDQIPPMWDDCWSSVPGLGAHLISVPGTFNANMTNASNDPSDPEFCCHTSGPAAGDGNGWFKFVVPAGRTSVQISTCRSSPPADDSLIQVFDCGDASNEQSCCQSLIAIGCNDDAVGCGDAGALSKLCVTGMTPGRTYYAMLAAKTNSSRGSYIVDITTPCTEQENTPNSCCNNDGECDDNKVCTTDTCVNGACVHVNNLNTCSDGIYCNGAERCVNGLCVAGELPCTSAQGCIEIDHSCGPCQSSQDCYDGLTCTTKSCVAGRCQYDENTCRGACCFSGAQCFDNLSTEQCASFSGSTYLGHELTCISDDDNDGVAGCADQCPRDPDKITPGYCGCGSPETDTDGDGIPDCADCCAGTSSGTQVDGNGCPQVGACRSSNGSACLDGTSAQFCDQIGGTYLGNGTTCAEPCLLCPPLQSLAIEPAGINKNRYLSFVVTNTPCESAIQVKFVSLMHPDPPNLPQFPPPNFAAQEGKVRYVGAPSNCVETESPPATFKCASLQCVPVYMDWEAALGGQTLHVTGQAVVPSSTYEVRQLAASCQGNEATCAAVSAPLTIATARWGDVASTFQAPLPAPLTQPNISDVAACVDKFKSVPTAIIVPRADVNPAVPNGRVDIADVANIVDAFKNLAYPFPGPAACP